MPIISSFQFSWMEEKIYDYTTLFWKNKSLLADGKGIGTVELNLYTYTVKCF